MPRGETIKRTRKLFELAGERGWALNWNDSLSNPEKMLRFLSDDHNKLCMHEIKTPDTKPQKNTDDRGLYLFETKTIFNEARKLHWPLRWQKSLSRAKRNQMLRYIHDISGRQFEVPKIVTKCRTEMMKIRNER